jgi:hypothetical protein
MSGQVEYRTKNFEVRKDSKEIQGPNLRWRLGGGLGGDRSWERG